MKLENIHSVFFVGIGGIGMSALARWFKKEGKVVAGYDRTKTQLCIQLEKEGFTIIYDDEINLIPVHFHTANEGILVVYTPAIPAENQIMTHFKSQAFQIRKRSEILGMITGNYYTIAVAGTHGKTTTSSLIAHILKECEISMTAFLGGITVNHESNFIFHNNPEKPDVKIVVEADEYDRSFLTLRPDIAIVTALDPDHLDIYINESEMKRGYASFINRIKENGTLIIKKNLIGEVMKDSDKPLNVYEYNLNRQVIRAEDIRIERDEMRFNYISPDITISNIPFAFPGFHNIENAIAAITACLLMDIDGERIKSALANFRGIKRRFEYIIYTDRIIYIDDYAHHPEEIKALLTSVRAIFRDKKITVVFQPHLFTRSRDFASEFAESLELADELILLNIYPAREKPIDGVTSQLIFDHVKNIKKHFVANEKLVEYLRSLETEVLITVGAGDIDQFVEPIKTMLEEKYEISE